MSEMAGDAADEVLCHFRQVRACSVNTCLQFRDGSEDLLVFIINVGNKHSVRRGPIQVSHVSL